MNRFLRIASRVAATYTKESDLRSRIQNAISEVLKTKNVGSIGTGSEMFPDLPQLDEMSWYLFWLGDTGKGKDIIALQSQDKRDIETLLEMDENSLDETEILREMMSDVNRVTAPDIMQKADERRRKQMN